MTSFSHLLKPLGILLAVLATSAAMAGATRLEKANALFEQGKYRASEIELKNLLRDDPGVAGGRLLLGRIYLKAGNGAAAEKELRRASDLGAEPKLWRLDLAESLLLQGKFGEALQNLDAASVPAADRARALALRGRAYLGLNQIDAAKSAFTEAAGLDPSEKLAGAGLVQLALLRGDKDAALSDSERLAAQFPDDPDLLLLRAEVYRQTGDTQAAIDQFGAVLKLDPQNIRALLGRATALLSLKEFDRARADLDAVDALKPDIVVVSYLRGVTAFYERDWDEASDALQRVLSVQPNHVQSQLLLGIISYAKNDLQLAEEYLSLAVRKMPDNPQAAKVLAATRLKLREPKRALEVLEPLANSGDVQVMALLGSGYLLAGEQQKGQEWLSRAVETAPDVASLRTQLALTLIAGGKLGDAIDELQAAVDLGQDVLQADVLLVLTQLKEQHYEQAVAASEGLEQRRPNSPIPYNLTGLAFLAQGKLDEARERFAKALEVDPKFTTALINLARVDLADKDLAGAEQSYRRVLQIDDKNLPALLGMAALADLNKDDAALEEWLRKARDGNPNVARPGLLLSRYLIEHQQYLQALTVASDLATRFPDDAEVLEMLGRAQTLSGEDASAIRSFDQVIAQRPDEPRLHYLKGGAQWKARDFGAAAQSFRRAIALKPDFVDARVALASVLAAAQSYDEAISVARDLQHDYPDRDVGFRIEGEVQVAAQNSSAAVGPLTKAQELSPNGGVVRQLADAYVRSQRHADAIRVLEGWTDEKPDDLATLGYLAMLLQGEGLQDRALAIYERIHAAGQANAAVLNNLAWLLNERGDARALEIAGKAYELEPNRAEVADTYGWILYQRGERDQGLRILQQAHLAYPTQTEIAYHTAVALDGLGRGAEAVNILRQLLRDYPDSPQVEDAQALLDKLTAGGAS